MGSERLSDDELAAIAARAEAATAGPWCVEGWRGDGVERIVAILAPDDTPLATMEGPHTAAATQRDAAFIAHARTDVPRLLAELARLRAVEAAAAAYVAARAASRDHRREPKSWSEEWRNEALRRAGVEDAKAEALVAALRGGR